MAGAADILGATSQPPDAWPLALLALFAGLLYSGIFPELRERRSAAREQADDGPDPRRATGSVVLTLLTVACVAGLATCGAALVGRPTRGLLTAAVLLAVVCPVLLAWRVVVVDVGPVLKRALATTLVLAAMGAVVALVLVSRSPTYEVYGTCASGLCGLYVRAEPTSNSDYLRRLNDNDRVRIACQTNGERLTAQNGTKSAVWDKLDGGGYVTDLYVDTPGVGKRSRELKTCPGANLRALG